MATLATTNPTLADVAKTLDPCGSVAKIIEILNQRNEILDDLTWTEGNLPTGHRTTIRTGLPEPSFRKLYGGIQPSKAESAQVTEDTAMLEDYAEIDKALADLNGNTADFRLAEEMAHIEGFDQKVTRSIFYGDQSVTPESFTGLAPRFNDLSAPNAENIIDAGGTESDNASIWIVVWDKLATQMIYPKGGKSGLQHNDKGQITIEDVDGNGGRMEAYRSHYRWDLGLCVKDWRQVVRICNIDKSALTADQSSGAKLTDLIIQGLEQIHNINAGRAAIYMPRAIRSMLRRQMVEKVASSTLAMDEVFGKKVMTCDGIPVRRVDALAADEARVV